MSVFKCKMCGGDIDLTEGSSVAVCEYCGTKQTVPTADNEKKMTLFARANRLRSACEFDKAASVYESIVADFPEEAEAYWGLVLCRYGIELEMSRNVQSGNTQNLKSTVIQRSFPKWSVAERRKTAAASDQAAVCACAHSRYFAGGSPSGLRV